MKKIKIAFVGLTEAYGSLDEILLYRVLKKNYDVEVMEDPKEAEYIICGVFANYEYCHYDQVRIMFSGENYIPDLNLVDYAISSYPITLQDRCFRLPVCIDQFGHCASLQRKQRVYDKEWLKGKKYFANFISSHDSEYNLRSQFFGRLEQYKRVEAPGKYLNNMQDGHVVKWTDSSKSDFQNSSKFTICFESTSHEGFVTEKITDAFYADTIPIYYGSSDVVDIFNENAFVRCKGRDDFEATVNRIIELDNNDEMYLEMMRQPIFVKTDYVDTVMADFEKFVKHIFDQPIEEAYRRSRVYAPKTYENHILHIMGNGYALKRATFFQLTEEITKRIGKKLLHK